jgi:flavin reductase (DIM6/NTAB) family NADH-FMN oxidoreductase RutF
MSVEEAFHELVSGTDYPMVIVTLAVGEEREGCLVGFFTQASIEPARLIVMLSKANRTGRLAHQATELVVHFARAADRDLASLFGEETGDDIDKFARCSWEVGPGGSPVLRGTRGWVSGRILDRLDAGDHVAHLLEISDAHVDSEGEQLSSQAVSAMEAGHPI